MHPTGMGLQGLLTCAHQSPIQGGTSRSLAGVANRGRTRQGLDNARHFQTRYQLFQSAENCRRIGQANDCTLLLKEEEGRCFLIAHLRHNVKNNRQVDERGDRSWKWGSLIRCDIGASITHMGVL